MTYLNKRNTDMEFSLQSEPVLAGFDEKRVKVPHG